MITMCTVFLPAITVLDHGITWPRSGASPGNTPACRRPSRRGSMGAVTLSAPDLPQVGDLLELTVGEAAHGGWCVARLASRPVIFVRHALPGERVRAVITQTTSRLARADATEILDASADRVQPPCPHARPGGCGGGGLQHRSPAGRRPRGGGGGCAWQHVSLAAQRSLRAAVVRQQLRRIAGIDREVIVEPMPGDETGLGCRTRVRYAAGPAGVAGLHRHRSHDVIEVGDCPIAHPLVTAAEATRRAWPGAAWVEVAAAPGSGQRAVITDRDVPGEPIDADSVISGRGIARGTGYLRQRAAGRDWRVSARGFWQVHPQAADTLAAAVLDALGPQPGETALDLYCGAGLFAGVLAGAVGSSGTVIGIESDAAGVRDARHNLRATPWARGHRGDVTAVRRRQGLSGASLVVLDPPRTGAARAAIELLSSRTGRVPPTPAV